MTTLARPNHAISSGAPRLNPAMLKGIIKSAITAAVFAGVIATAYLLLPQLEATGNWAYGIGFLIQATTSASIVVPIPGMAALMVMSQDMNLLSLAAAGAAGGAIGELFGYWLGSQGRGPLVKTGLYRKLEPAMKRFGGAIVFLFAAIPVLPMDLAGIVAGATRYPVARYLTAMFAGKFLLLTIGFLAAREFVSAFAILDKWIPLG
ncbi:MAG: VTT domain-containing protein [Chloroflexi bacterium]|nr:VTT domain-containing protein [Chloroflexota bacterium]